MARKANMAERAQNETLRRLSTELPALLHGFRPPPGEREGGHDRSNVCRKSVKAKDFGRDGQMRPSVRQLSSHPYGASDGQMSRQERIDETWALFPYQHPGAMWLRSNGSIIVCTICSSRFTPDLAAAFEDAASAFCETHSECPEGYGITKDADPLFAV